MAETKIESIRFEGKSGPIPAVLFTHFIGAYREVNSELPANWEDVARVMDIGNMCFFLERKEDYQESFRTARLLVEATLEHFGY